MNCKRHLFLLALLLVACDLRAQTLVLHHADGTTTDVELFTQPRVQFEGNRVLITSSVLSMEYPKDNVLRFTYRGAPQGIEIPSSDADMSRDGDRLVFHNVKAADKVAVYTSSGIRVPVRITSTGSDAVLSLSQIPSGVYLLSVNDRTSKFTKP